MLLVSMRKHGGFRIEKKNSDSKKEYFQKRNLSVGKLSQFPHREKYRFFRQKVVFWAVLFR